MPRAPMFVAGPNAVMSRDIGDATVRWKLPADRDDPPIILSIEPHFEGANVPTEAEALEDIIEYIADKRDAAREDALHEHLERGGRV